MSHGRGLISAVDGDRGESHWTFAEWVDLLGGHFFAPDRAGRPVTLFVDDEILSNLSGLSKDLAAGSLVGAITSLFGDLAQERASHDVLRTTTAWERSGSEGYIRCLPLLALAVLAGTRMASDGEIRKTNYYKRYRALIGLTGGGQPPGYEVMPDLWDAYARWLDETLGGALGISTVAEHPTYRYIGHALSQALVRASDRHELTYFLDSLGVPVTDAISGERLVALLSTWAEWRGRFSPGARILLKDPAYAAQLDLLIRDAARRWDGTVLDDLGRKESRILLHWNYEDGEPLATLAERPEGFPDEIQVGAGPARRVLTMMPNTRFYREAPVVVDAGLLQDGCRIRTGAFSFRLPGSGIHLLSANDELPGWSSARRFGWGRRHMVIAGAATALALRALLERGAEPGFTGPRGHGSLPEGWVAFRSVTPRPEAAEAWADSPLGQLLPIESPKASLANGLRLSRARVYLVGGEPDLVCPANAFELDGERYTAVPGSVVSLRGRRLGPGRHMITVGAQYLRFALARGSAGVPALAEPARTRVARDAAVAGAAAPAEWARERWTCTMRAKQRCLAVGARPGQLARLERQPQVRPTVGVVWSPLAESEVPFEPVWVITIDARRVKSVKLVSALEPEATTQVAADPVLKWARVFLVPSPGAPALWQRYVEAAREIMGADGAA